MPELPLDAIQLAWLRRLHIIQTSEQGIRSRSMSAPSTGYSAMIVTLRSDDRLRQV